MKDIEKFKSYHSEKKFVEIPVLKTGRSQLGYSGTTDH